MSIESKQKTCNKISVFEPIGIQLFVEMTLKKKDETQLFYDRLITNVSLKGRIFSFPMLV